MSLSSSHFFRPYAKLSLVRRLFIAVLAVTAALGILYALLNRHADTPRPQPPPTPDVAACTAGQTTACVGSPTRVITTPSR
jgi:hypothetical protein